MPAVHPPDTVLVTGASGFLGTWATRALLAAGFRVRAAVRAQDKADFLATLHAAHAAAFETVLVPDITKDGAFDAAVDGAQAVVHIAGSTTFAADDPAEIVELAVKSTVGLLQSAARSPGVRRVLYMSSAQALLGQDLAHVYTEDDWNDGAVAEVREKGAAASGQSKYAASKVLAERAAREFVAAHTPAWDLTSLVPCWVFGPVIHNVKSLAELNLSSAVLYDFIANPRQGAALQGYGSEYIDVRDVADAVVAALTTEAAGGERFILDAGVFTPQNLYDALNTGAPPPGVPRGDPGAPKFSFPGPFCNPAKAVAALGLAFRPLAECAKDAWVSYGEKGILV